MVARIPPVHILVGKLEESPESHGTPPLPFFSAFPLQRWQMPEKVPLLLRSPGLPATIRKPFYSLEGLAVTRITTYRLEGRRFGGTAKRLHVIDGNAPFLLKQLTAAAIAVVGHLRDQLVGAVLGGWRVISRS